MHDICISVYIPRPTYLPIHIPTYPPTYPPTYLPTHLPTYIVYGFLPRPLSMYDVCISLPKALVRCPFGCLRGPQTGVPYKDSPKNRRAGGWCYSECCWDLRSLFGRNGSGSRRRYQAPPHKVKPRKIQAAHEKMTMSACVIGGSMERQTHPQNSTSHLTKRTLEYRRKNRQCQYTAHDFIKPTIPEPKIFRKSYFEAHVKAVSGIPNEVAYTPPKLQISYSQLQL